MVELLVTKLEAVESKERSGAVELRNVKERFVIAETKVTTQLEVTERSRDRVTSRPAPRRQEAARRSDRAERDEYDDYDRADERDDYRDDTGYSGGARRYPAEKRRRSDGYSNATKIRTVITIATMIRIVVCRAIRVFERMANKTERVLIVELVHMVFGSVFVVSFS